MKASILLIEDDPGTGAALQKVMRAEGYEVTLVTRAEEGLRIAEQVAFDLVLTDFKLPGASGLEVIAQLHAGNPRLPIILMTSHGTTDTAIEATKLGAFEYLTKPFDPDELLVLVKTSVGRSRSMTEKVELGEVKPGAAALVGKSRAMQNLYKEIGRVAATPVTVLIRGATGTGKELVARALYQHSDRVSRPFVAVNCAAIPQTLLESELFGHERGAFTGAHAQRIGRFEQAHGGTLFLDEIGDLPIDTQAKLLRVLQERTIQRLGGDRNIPVDVRVLSATHRDLEEAIREKEFREDLFYRLSVVSLFLPRLSERREDIPDLVRHCVQKYSADLGIKNPSIEPAAIERLQQMAWPGNVRELENVMRQALLAAGPFPVGVEQVEQAAARSNKPAHTPGTSHTDYISQLIQQAERGECDDAYWRMIRDLEPELFRQAITRAGGNQAKAARWLGITRLKMREKLAELGWNSGNDAVAPSDS